MIVLASNDYYVRIELDGGQVSRFKDENSNVEYIFNGDIKHWAYTTPTLFPIIGRSYDDQYHFKDQVTTMGKHGILRDVKFNLMKHVGNTVVLEYRADEESLKKFPYDFSMQIMYTLIKNKLSIEYTIVNHGDKEMPYNFGLHPAFSCPLDKDKSFEDYKLKFATPVKLRGSGPKVNEGLVSEIPLSYEGFEKDNTWIYHNLPCSTVGFTDGKHGVDVSVVGYPLVGVWTNLDTKAPFICIEPWLGYGKQVEKDIPFEERDAVMSLSPQREMKYTYTITVY